MNSPSPLPPPPPPPPGLHSSIAAEISWQRHESQQSMTRSVFKVDGVPSAISPSVMEYVVNHCLLVHSEHIETIVLTHLNLGPSPRDTLRPLVKFLTDPRCSVRSLQLKSNRMGEAAACDVIEALEHNKTVTHLDLSTNYLETEVFGAAVRRLLKTLTTTGSGGIRVHKPLPLHLNVSWNWMDRKAVRQLALGLSEASSLLSSPMQTSPLRTLVGLDLSGCLLGDRGAAEVLCHASRLSILNLAVNSLSAASLSRVASMLSDSECALQELNLSCNENLFQSALEQGESDEEEEEGEDMNDGRGQQQQEVSTTRNLIDDEPGSDLPTESATHVFASALAHNNTLTFLNLTRTNPRLVHISQIARALETNTTLQTLDLSNNHFSLMESDDDGNDNDDPLISSIEELRNVYHKSMPRWKGLRHLRIPLSVGPTVNHLQQCNLSLWSVVYNPADGSIDNDMDATRLERVFVRNRAYHKAEALLLLQNNGTTNNGTAGVDVCQLALHDMVRDSKEGAYCLLRQRLLNTIVALMPEPTA